MICQTLVSYIFRTLTSSESYFFNYLEIFVSLEKFVGIINYVAYLNKMFHKYIF